MATPTSPSEELGTPVEPTTEPPKAAEIPVAEEIRSQVETLLARSFIRTYAPYLEKAMQGRPTPLETVEQLITRVLAENDIQVSDKAKKREAISTRGDLRRAILQLIIPAGVIVTGRSDIYTLLGKLDQLNVFILESEATGKIRFGTRPLPQDTTTKTLSKTDVNIDPARFPIVTEPGAAPVEFTWRGQLIHRLPEN